MSAVNVFDLRIHAMNFALKLTEVTTGRQGQKVSPDVLVANAKVIHTFLETGK